MKSKTQVASEPQRYDVTATDDTRIRRVIASELKWGDARFHVDEILHAHKRRWWNPRIRKHRKQD